MKNVRGGPFNQKFMIFGHLMALSVLRSLQEKDHRIQASAKKVET